MIDPDKLSRKVNDTFVDFYRKAVKKSDEPSTTPDALYSMAYTKFILGNQLFETEDTTSSSDLFQKL
jgi:hypothetical protein